ncbi:MAG TPA: hypothetical protein VFE62_25755, partial [Gemmataceae bacterium]|nr:hypothetical protein [Gemmataceae bacterium]
MLDIAAVERFAASRHKEQQGNWMYADRLGGFCLLVKRAMLAKIGPALAERSDLNLFDSDILSSKAQQAGSSLAVCRDRFVHHFGRLRKNKKGSSGFLVGDFLRRTTYGASIRRGKSRGFQVLRWVQIEAAAVKEDRRL